MFDPKTASLGDILGHMLANRSTSEETTMELSEVNIEDSTVPDYFENARKLTPAANQIIDRAKKYRVKYPYLTLIDAKYRVETMILIEMLNQAVDMKDVQLIREWATERMYTSLNR